MADVEIVEQLDAALTRFLLARARREREKGRVVVDEHHRWTGEEVLSSR